VPSRPWDMESAQTKSLLRLKENHFQNKPTDLRKRLAVGLFARKNVRPQESDGHESARKGVRPPRSFNSEKEREKTAKRAPQQVEVYQQPASDGAPRGKKTLPGKVGGRSNQDFGGLRWKSLASA